MVKIPHRKKNYIQKRMWLGHCQNSYLTPLKVMSCLSLVKMYWKVLEEGEVKKKEEEKEERRRKGKKSGEKEEKEEKRRGERHFY